MYKLNSKRNTPIELFQSKIGLIVISDQHIGVKSKHHPSFLTLLKEFRLKIEKNDSFNEKEIKPIVMITGDLLDLLLNNHISIRNNSLYQEILTELDLLYQNGISILMTLGNHEISYLGEFKINKERLFNQLHEFGFHYSFLNPKFAGQLAIIKADLNNPNISQIGLYDSIEDYNSNNLVFCSKVNMILPKEKEYLFIHGHQFSNSFSKFACYFFWNRLFQKQVNFSNFKKILSESGSLTETLQVWRKNNGNFQTFQMNSMMNSEIQEKPKDLSFVHKILNILKFFIDPWINWTTSKGAIRYLQKNQLKNISLIVYGHTHNVYHNYSRYKLNKKSIPVLNSGGWIGVFKPSFLQFEKNGSISIILYDPIKMNSELQEVEINVV